MTSTTQKITFSQSTPVSLFLIDIYRKNLKVATKSSAESTSHKRPLRQSGNRTPNCTYPTEIHREDTNGERRGLSTNKQLDNRRNDREHQLKTQLEDAGDRSVRGAGISVQKHNVLDNSTDMDEKRIDLDDAANLNNNPNVWDGTTDSNDSKENRDASNDTLDTNENRNVSDDTADSKENNSLLDDYADSKDDAADSNDNSNTSDDPEERSFTSKAIADNANSHKADDESEPTSPHHRLQGKCGAFDEEGIASPYLKLAARVTSVGKRALHLNVNETKMRLKPIASLEEREDYELLLSEEQKFKRCLADVCAFLSDENTKSFDATFPKEECRKYVGRLNRFLLPKEIDIQANPSHGLIPPGLYFLPREQQLKHEIVRLATFATRTNLAVSPIRLAHNGIYYDDDRNAYVCFSCGLVKTHWAASEKKVELIHMQLSPDCAQAVDEDETNVAIDNDETVAADGGDRDENGAPGRSSASSCCHVPGSSGASGGGAAAASPHRNAANVSTTARERPPPGPPSSARPHQNGPVGTTQTRHPSASREALPQHRQQQLQQQQQIPSTVTDSRAGEAAPSSRPERPTARDPPAPSSSSSSARQAGAPSSGGSTPSSARPAASAFSRPGRGSDTTDSSCARSSGALPNEAPDVQIESDGSDLATDEAEPVELDKTRAASPQNCSASARFHTFAGWPGHGLPHPRLLVAAGFFYTGAQDCVRCFYCGVTLRNWREHDDPWIMHVRYRFSCEYVVAVRGERFVLQASEAVAQGRTAINGTEMSASAQQSAVPNGFGHDSSTTQRPTTTTTQSQTAPGSGSGSTAETGSPPPVVSSLGSVVSSGTGVNAGVCTSTAPRNNTATGNSTSTGNGPSAGNNTATGIGSSAGNSTASGIGSSAGNSTASGIGSSAGNSTASGTGPSAGKSTASGNRPSPRNSTPSGNGTSSGRSSASGNNSAVGKGVSAGSSTAAGISTAHGKSTATENGTVPGNIPAAENSQLTRKSTATGTDTRAGHSSAMAPLKTASETSTPGGRTSPTENGTPSATISRPNADTATDSDCTADSERSAAVTDSGRRNTTTDSRRTGTATVSGRSAAAPGAERPSSKSPGPASPRGGTKLSQDPPSSSRRPTVSKPTLSKEGWSTTRPATVAYAAVNMNGGAAQVQAVDYSELHRANRNLRQTFRCRLCGERDVETIFLPCGHLCVCESCSDTIAYCCLCGERIVATTRVRFDD